MASRSEDKRREWDVFKPRVDVQLTGSVAYKLAELSTGNGDATFTLTPKNEWDNCAGTPLVEEAAAGSRTSPASGSSSTSPRRSGPG